MLVPFSFGSVSFSLFFQFFFCVQLIFCICLSLFCSLFLVPTRWRTSFALVFVLVPCLYCVSASPIVKTTNNNFTATENENFRQNQHTIFRERNYTFTQTHTQKHRHTPNPLHLREPPNTPIGCFSYLELKIQSEVFNGNYLFGNGQSGKIFQRNREVMFTSNVHVKITLWTNQFCCPELFSLESLRPWKRLLKIFGYLFNEWTRNWTHIICSSATKVSFTYWQLYHC